MKIQKNLREIGREIANTLSNSFVSSVNLVSAIVTIYMAGKGAVFGLFLVVTLTLFANIMLANKNFWKRIKQFFTKSKIETISKNNPMNKLNDNQRKDIIGTMNEATKAVAKSLEINPRLIRSNLFFVDENSRMRMIKELTVNMNRKEELTITMPVGYGCVGRCFQSRKPNIAILTEDSRTEILWGENMVEELELRKCHPDLQWIISCPILRLENKQYQSLLVMNVDCLQERRKKEELEKALSELFTWAQMLCMIITEDNFEQEN